MEHARLTFDTVSVRAEGPISKRCLRCVCAPRKTHTEVAPIVAAARQRLPSSGRHRPIETRGFLRNDQQKIVTCCEFPSEWPQNLNKIVQWSRNLYGRRRAAM